MGPAAGAIASSSAVSNNTAATSTARNHRPRLNIQKASDYSLLSSTTTTASSGLAAATSTIPTTPQVQGEKENEQKWRESIL